MLLGAGSREQCVQARCRRESEGRGKTAETGKELGTDRFAKPLRGPRGVVCRAKPLLGILDVRRERREHE